VFASVLANFAKKAVYGLAFNIATFLTTAGHYPATGDEVTMSLWQWIAVPLLVGAGGALTKLISNLNASKNTTG